MTWLLGVSVLIAGIAIVGGLVPMFLRRTERAQHLLIAFAAGVFLGAVFLHLLPEVASMAESHAHEHVDGNGEVHQHAAGRGLIWACVLVGLVVVYLVENLMLRRSDADVSGEERHRMLGWATFLGLSVHAFTAGLGLSAGVELPELRTSLLLSVVGHKGVEGFSLGVAFLLARMPRRRVMLLIVLFALITPLGAFVRAWIAPDLSGLALHIMTALAAGTFLFIAVCDLLPEVFHHRKDTLAKIMLLAAGVSVDQVIHLIVE